MFSMTFASAQNQPDVATLCDGLHAARARTLAFAARLKSEQWLGPQLSIVNPPQWELAHLAWFQEHWCLRLRADGTLAPSILLNADVLYNSATVPHAERWTLALLPVDQTLAYLREVLDAVQTRITREGATEHLRYFAQLAAFHEEMHNEAFDYTCQTLQYPFEKNIKKQIVTSKPHIGDATISGGQFMLGAQPGHGFVFDNEKWAHEVAVRPFRMARAAVSHAEFAAFVDDGGYDRSELWQEEGWAWLQVQAAGDGRHVSGRGPRYVDQIGVASGAVMQNRFGSARRMLGGQPAMHLTWWEADAWCRWAGRRLPAEVEWEAAAHTAARGGFHWGDVWEWTGTTFRGYPGFTAGPWRDYSEPSFGSHKVLRGASFATRQRIKNAKFRNFELPHVNHIFGGFRSCAV